MKKIAVLRANALGDFIFILPALQALRDSFPHAEITLLGKQWHQSFLSGRPAPVDRVIIVPPYPGVGEPEDYRPDPAVNAAFFAAMVLENFDLAIQLHGGGRNSNPFVRRLGAKKTVGLKTPDAEALDVNISYVYHFNETLRYLEVAAAAGARPRSVVPRLDSIYSDLEEAAAALDNPDHLPLAVVHPGATDIRRRWPAEKFAGIADELTAAGYLVCITGTPAETEVAAAVARQASAPLRIRNLCGTISLGGLTGLLSMAALMISNDTGPLHLARALDTPTIGLFWCINSITGLSMVTDVHRTHVSWQFCCPVCGLSPKHFASNPGGCMHQTSFLTDITEDEVRASVRELIAVLNSRTDVRRSERRMSDINGNHESFSPHTDL
ncbi:MAG TPA: glycosyltransferase family 9 protein [Sphingobacteriaceae bacterium]